MTEEKLDRANKLRTAINELKRHRQKIRELTASSSNKLFSYGYASNDSDVRFVLRDEFIPMDGEALKNGYFAKIDEAISKLEVEFSEL